MRRSSRALLSLTLLGGCDPACELAFVDADGDGFGSALEGREACELAEGWSRVAGDCDDARADAFPGADERCDGADEDCDGVADDAPVDGATFYFDADGDGYGHDPLVACEAPGGYVAVDGDCEDEDAAVYPGVTVAWADADADGYGDAASPVLACEPATGAVVDASDCDDGDGDVHPAATELCDDGVDQDCDGTSAGCLLEGRHLAADLAGLRIDGDPDASMGMAVAGGSDLGGDGLPDLVVVAWTGTHLFDGALTGAATAADAFATTPVFDTVATGDANGDGHADLLGSQNSSTSGQVWLLDGPFAGEVGTDGARFTYTGWQRAGESLAMNGDADGDGVHDVAIGTYSTLVRDFAGEYALFSGGREGAFTATDADLHVSTDGSWRLGAAVTLADLDGDGLAELLVAGEGAWELVRFASGATGAITLADAEGRLRVLAEIEGLAVADLDGDGVDDVLLAAKDAQTHAGEHAGAAFGIGAFSGETGFDEAKVTLLGSTELDSAGTGVAAADIDGDGAVDAIVGSELDATSDGGGGAYIVYGPLSGTWELADADALLVATDGDELDELATVGDVDGDGRADLLLGAWGHADHAGVAWLVHGQGL